MRHRTLIALAVGALLALGAVPAQADLIPVLTGVTPGPGGFLWTFDVTVAPDQKMSPLGVTPGPGVTPADDTRSLKDYVTFYDFGGVVILPDTTGFGFATYDIGSTPTRANPDADLANFINITVYRQGDLSLPGPTTFTVTIGSIFSSPVLGFFSSDGTKQAPGTPTNNTGVSNAGRVETPFRLAQVPEPGTLLLMGAGLLGLGMYRRRNA
jgi:hypothetical protein